MTVNNTTFQEPSVLTKMVNVTGLNRTPQDAERAQNALRLLAVRAEEQYVAAAEQSSLTPEENDGEPVIADPQSFIDAAIAYLDEQLSLQLSEVMHHPDFRALEGSWRGLNHLVYHSETSPTLKIKVMDATKDELREDFRDASEFDQSTLFKKIYTEELGQHGGHPYAAMIGDYEFSHTNADVSLLKSLAQVAAQSHAPFISAASPALFGLQSYTEMENIRDVAKIFDATEYTQWRSFRESLDSRYVALTLPRVMARLPYGENTDRAKSFAFEEDVYQDARLRDGGGGTDHDKFIWMNAAYALAERLTHAHARYGWTLAIRGVDGGGEIEDLPAFISPGDYGDMEMKCPTEAALPNRRDNELANAGFIPLVYEKHTDRAVFISGQTLNKPQEYDQPNATASARLSSGLPYVMAASRIAHYMNVIVQQKLGSFATAKNVQDHLHNWIHQYVLDDDHGGQEKKAEKPLRRAKVEVRDIPGKPGYYTCVVHLTPHVQLEGVQTSLRLVTDLNGSDK